MTIEERLIEADKSWNAGTIVECIVEIMRENPRTTMLDIEMALRSIGSKATYLVAWPRAQIPFGVRPINIIDGTPAEYGLWICVNGESDMLATLQQFGLTIAQNLDALRHTGINAA